MNTITPSGDEPGIILHQACLHDPRRPAQDLHNEGQDIHQAVDDPGIPEAREFRGHAGEPAHAVDATIHHAQVKCGQRAAQVFDAVYEKGVIDFVDVILVEQNPVQTWRRGRHAIGKPRLLNIHPVSNR